MLVAKNIATFPVALMGGAAGILAIASFLKGKPPAPLPRPKTTTAIPMKLLTAELEKRIEKKK